MNADCQSENIKHSEYVNQKLNHFDNNSFRQLTEKWKENVKTYVLYYESVRTVVFLIQETTVHLTYVLKNK
jgi:hypothetical protein